MSKLILPCKRHYGEGEDEEPIHENEDDVGMTDIQFGVDGGFVDPTLMVVDDDDDVDKEKTNLVYLYMRISDDWDKWPMDWYVLDIDAVKLYKDENMSSFSLPRLFACAVLGSKVYAIGGEDSRVVTRDVKVYDTINREWKDAPQMNVSRSLALAVSLGTKIYVFGGRDTPIWSEYYDSTFNNWTSIPDPPPEFMFSEIYRGSVVYGMDTIIIWNRDDFCLLDVSGSIPKWHCIKGPNIGDWFDYVSNITAVVNGIVYWSARDLFAFDLAHNKGFDKPAFKFDHSDSTVAPSVDFLRIADAVPPILVPTGQDQLSVIWYSEETEADQMLKVYFKKFRIQTSLDDPEKPLLLHNDHDPTENFEFNIPAKQIYQYGAVQWHNDDKGKDNLYRGDTKHAILNHVDLLRNLSCSMYKENFNSFSRIKKKVVGVELKDGELELIDLELKDQLAQQKELCEKDDISMEDFLSGLGLQKYAKTFMENNIDMNGLKIMSKEMLKNLNIPKGPSKEILSAISLTS